MALIRSAFRGPESRAGWTSEADLVGGDRIDQAQIAAALSQPDSRLLVAERDGRLAGCCRVYARGEGTACLGSLAVDPQRQGAGIGRQLVGEAAALARTQLGCHTIEITVLEPQTVLRAWYERLGFAATGETRPFPADPVHARPLRGGLRFVVLERALS